MADETGGLPERVHSIERKLDDLAVSAEHRFDRVDDAFLAQRSYTDLAYERLDAKMEAGFSRLGQKMDAGFARMETRFAQVDGRSAEVDARFVQIDARFVQIDARFVQIDARFAQVDARFDTLEQKVDQIIFYLRKVPPDKTDQISEQISRNQRQRGDPQ